MKTKFSHQISTIFFGQGIGVSDFGDGAMEGRVKDSHIGDIFFCQELSHGLNTCDIMGIVSVKILKTIFGVRRIRRKKIFSISVEIKRKNI